MTSDNHNPDISKIESIRATIIKALDKNDTEFAMELVDYWDSVFPMEEEGRSLFLYTKLQVLLQCYDSTEVFSAKTEYLRNAIETGNNFFAANEAEGFPMDPEVMNMWYNLLDRSSAYAAQDSQDTEECESDGCDVECGDCEMFEYCDKIDRGGDATEDIIATIGRVNPPKFKPKPPRIYDDSLNSKLLKAVDRYMKEYEDLDYSAYHLLGYICEELSINYDDFYTRIYEY